jgi:hypothetical protein
MTASPANVEMLVAMGIPAQQAVDLLKVFKTSTLLLLTNRPKGITWSERLICSLTHRLRYE